MSNIHAFQPETKKMEIGEEKDFHIDRVKPRDGANFARKLMEAAEENAPVKTPPQTEPAGDPTAEPIAEPTTPPTGDQPNADNQQLEKIRVYVYDNAIKISDGPFRFFKDPANIPLLRAIALGAIPEGHEDEFSGKLVVLRRERSNAVEGRGHILGSS